MKLFFIVVLVMLSSLVLIPDIGVSDAQQDTEKTYTTHTLCNYSYIWDKTKNLTDIIKVHLQSRYFGTEGEHKAADNIKNWMSLLGLSNVHNETINGWWGPIVSYQSLFIKKMKDLYQGALNRRRTKQKFYLNVTVYTKDPYEYYTSKNFTFNTDEDENICFPMWIVPYRPLLKFYRKIKTLCKRRILEKFSWKVSRES